MTTILQRLQKKSGYEYESQIRIVVSQKTKIVIQWHEMHEFISLSRIRSHVLRAVSDYLMIGKTRLRKMWHDEKIAKLTGKPIADNFKVPLYHFGD